MNKEMKQLINSGKPVDRATVLTLLQVGLDAGEVRFVRRVAEDWLNAYPYDLHVELLRARGLVHESKAQMAFKVLRRLCELDPEFVEAQEQLAKVARRVKPDAAEAARAAAIVLRNPYEVVTDIQPWAQHLIRARLAFNAGDLGQAEAHAQAALLAEPPSPLPALLYIKIAQAQGLSWLAVQNLVELYMQDWKHCLQLRLQKAAMLMEGGQEKQAVDLLHDCAAEDVSGQVARRLWGEQHRFTALWPGKLAQAIGTPVPAKVAAGLGWNQLETQATRYNAIAAGEETKKKSIPQPQPEYLGAHTAGLDEVAPPEEPAEASEPEAHSLLFASPVFGEADTAGAEPVTQAHTAAPVEELAPVAEETPAQTHAAHSAQSDEEINQVLQQMLSAMPETLIDLEEVNTATAESLRLRADGRYPAYILLSSKENLTKQFNIDGFANIDIGLQAVAAATDKLPKWSAYVLYVDDETSTGAFGLKAISPNDPWAIKNLLADLDEALRQKGEMIGALLIVGGPKVIPFHHLPNPVDDDDKDVPSDNPYASLDENYFVPTWPAGRLPTGVEKDPAALLKALNRIEASREAVAERSNPLREFITRILMMLGIWRPKRSSFGYSAEVWRRASHSVYRAIGEPRRLSVCPPTQAGKLPKEASKALQVAYFNLHGIEDGPDWYGQRDPLTTPDGPDYPVALTPGDVVNSGRAPQVVFSEACYGANVFNKSIDTALALKFIDSGSKVVVGSTVTSYGSVATPLIAADLLGQTFWRLLNEGHPAGEALRRAKIAMAQTMHNRQGYLDGEDQKTLISFVLYGDPLAQVSAEATLPKRILRAEPGELNTVCDLPESQRFGARRIEDLPEETLSTVKAVVKEYLPGMLGSEVSFSHEHTDCQNHDCPLPHAKRTRLAPSRSLVTLSKKVPGEGRLHAQYARITMDAQGKVVKLAVSR